MPPHLPPLPPRFTAERVLTTGSRATTVLARDRLLDRVVVIKLVDLVHGHGPEDGERFDREARAAASVNHPNVVSVFDYGSHAGARYLVLRHIEGESLRAYLDRRGRVGPGEAVRIAGQILAGLGAIHAAGVVHRDINPENIIVGADGLLRIANFGVASAPDERQSSMQSPSWSAPAYIAPEQSFGFGTGPATDLYAVGVLLFEMLTGEFPFPLGASPALAFARAATPPAMCEIVPNAGIPPELETVARKALMTNPDDRFKSAAAMAEALIALPAETDEPEAVRTGVVPAEASAAPFNPLVQSMPPLRPSRPAPWLSAAIPALIAALIAALIGGAVASHLWSDGGAPTAPVDAAASSRPTATSAVAAVIETPTKAPTTARLAPTPTEGLHAILAATKLPAAEPTSTPSPAATNSPKRKKKPSPTPTVATSSFDESFSVSDWSGAFSGNQSWYGRPWVAIYGAQSQYPHATLAFSLDDAPVSSATLTLDGLDDEWAGNVEIEVTVNGVAIFSGPSPFSSWDGQGHGENAAWSSCPFEIPQGVLQAGENQIVVANLEPAANFGTGPYVLLSDATISAP